MNDDVRKLLEKPETHEWIRFSTTEPWECRSFDHLQVPGAELVLETRTAGRFEVTVQASIKGGGDLLLMVDRRRAGNCAASASGRGPLSIVTIQFDCVVKLDPGTHKFWLRGAALAGKVAPRGPKEWAPRKNPLLVVVRDPETPLVFKVVRLPGAVAKLH